VPVLSKQTMLTLPPMLTLVGEMQKMSFLRRREMAKEVPIAIVAGRAGGTTMVMRSRARMMMTDQEMPSLTKLKELAMKPQTATPARTPMKRKESR
jgi:hypothetical protein